MEGGTFAEQAEGVLVNAKLYKCGSQGQVMRLRLRCNADGQLLFVVPGVLRQYMVSDKPVWLKSRLDALRSRLVLLAWEQSFELQNISSLSLCLQKV